MTDGPWMGEAMPTGRVGDPPAALDPERKGDPRSTASGKAPGARFEIYEAADEWRWRLVAANNETVASGEGFGGGEAGARRAVGSVIRTVADAQLAYGEPVIEVVDE